MKKPLHLISCIPNSPQFLWETANNLYNQRKYGLSNKARVLIFLTNSSLSQGFDSRWKFLEHRFPEVKFFYYKDLANIERVIRAFNYIPLLRPWLLEQHWKEFPELQNGVIYYHDSDTVFTNFPNFLRDLKDDSTCYLSDTKSYLNYDYLIGKKKDAKIQEFDSQKVVNKLETILGIPEGTFLKNNNSTGGAQYLLKNIDIQFWKDVFNNSIEIRSYLSDINKRFFESEDAGYQSWCADMWAVLGNLWKREFEVKTPKEMDFCFATDSVDKWDEKIIYHDANASPKPIKIGDTYHRTFWKKGPENSYTKGWESDELRSPFDDDLSFVSKELCSSKYVECLLETKKYLLL